MLRHRHMKNTGSLRRIAFGILFWSMANGIYAQTTPGMQPDTNWDFSGRGQRQLRSNSPNTPTNIHLF